jgi:hypothetical protein
MVVKCASLKPSPAQSYFVAICLCRLASNLRFKVRIESNVENRYENLHEKCGGSRKKLDILCFLKRCLPTTIFTNIFTSVLSVLINLATISVLSFVKLSA